MAAAAAAPPPPGDATGRGAPKHTVQPGSERVFRLPLAWHVSKLRRWACFYMEVCSRGSGTEEDSGLGEGDAGAEAGRSEEGDAGAEAGRSEEGDAGAVPGAVGLPALADGASRTMRLPEWFDRMPEPERKEVMKRRVLARLWTVVDQEAPHGGLRTLLKSNKRQVHGLRLSDGDAIEIAPRRPKS